MSKKYLVDIDLNGNELQNAVIQNLASAPENPKEGQSYYNTTDKKFFIYSVIDATGKSSSLIFSPSGIM